MELPLQPEDAYVWGDYFVHDGQVLHMLPSPITSDNKIPAGASVMLGEPGGEDEEWVIGPAFGNDLLVVFATSQPLYEGNRPQLESITGYLEFLRSRFASVLPGDTIRVATRLVRTEEG